MDKDISDQSSIKKDEVILNMHIFHVIIKLQEIAEYAINKIKQLTHLELASNTNSEFSDSILKEAEMILDIINENTSNNPPPALLPDEIQCI